MESYILKIKQRITTSLVTTALALLILSTVAILYDGTVICINSIYETFFVCSFLQGILWILEQWENESFLIDLIVRYTVVIVVVLTGAYIFHWLDNLPLIVLVGMAVVIYFLGCVVEVKRLQTEVRIINEITR